MASLTLLPAFAAAETVVPPGNSAATQYTEGFPTSGGNAKANSGINGDASPAKVIGSGNTKKLESKGQVGQEVADLAAETAPAAVTSEPSSKPGDGHHGSSAAGGAGENGGSGGNGSGNAGKAGSGGAGAEGAGAGQGSSGFGEVVSQATGSSSGQLGLFLPLIILGTVLWSLDFLRRQRRQVG